MLLGSIRIQDRLALQGKAPQLVRKVMQAQSISSLDKPFTKSLS